MPHSKNKISAFFVGKEIGHGGMATVYAGEHILHGTPVAIKVLKTDDPKLATELMREAHLVSRLNHANIIQLLDLGTLPEGSPYGKKGVPFYVMKRCNSTLQDVYRAPRSWAELRGLLRSLLKAIAHAHAMGVVHRDIKLSNVLFATDNRPLLADFGIAHQRGDSSRSAGTLSYMAPEQHAGIDVGPWTDLFALGVLAWRLTGSHLWTNHTFTPLMREKLQPERPTLRPIFPVPRAFERWLLLMLQGPWPLRYQTAAAALHGLSLVPKETETSNQFTPSLYEEMTTVITEICARDLPDSPEEPSSKQQTPAPRAPFPEEVPHAWEIPESVDNALPGTKLIGVRQPRFLGRSKQRERLWRELQEVTSHQESRFVVLHGAPGSGRARLARWFAVRCHEVVGAHTIELRSFSDALQTLNGVLEQALLIDNTHPKTILKRLSRWRLLNTERRATVGRLAGLTNWHFVLPIVLKVLTWLTERAPVVLIALDIQRPTSASMVWDAAHRALAQCTTQGDLSPPLLWVGTGTSGTQRDLFVPPLAHATMESLALQWSALEEEQLAQVLYRSEGLPGKMQQILSSGVLSEQEPGLRSWPVGKSALVVLAAAARLAPAVEISALEQIITKVGFAFHQPLQELTDSGLLISHRQHLRFPSYSVLVAAKSHLKLFSKLAMACGDRCLQKGDFIGASRCFEEANVPEKTLQACLLVSDVRCSSVENHEICSRLELLLTKRAWPLPSLERGFFHLAGLLLEGSSDWASDAQSLTTLAQQKGAVSATYYLTMARESDDIPWANVKPLRPKIGTPVSHPLLRGLCWEALYSPSLNHDERLALFERVLQGVNTLEVHQNIRIKCLCNYTTYTKSDRFLPTLIEAAEVADEQTLAGLTVAFLTLNDHKSAIPLLIRRIDVDLQSGKNPQIYFVMLAMSQLYRHHYLAAIDACRRALSCELLSEEVLVVTHAVWLVCESHNGQVREAKRRVPHIDCGRVTQSGRLDLQKIFSHLTEPSVRSALHEVLTDLDGTTST